MHCGTRTSRDRDQCRGDAPVLGDQHVVGARRGPGLHGVEANAGAAAKEARTPLLDEGRLLAGAEEKDLDRVRFGKDGRERGFVDFRDAARPATPCTPEGSARIEPRWPMPPKRNPPSP